MTGAALLLATMLAGGLGAMARFVLDAWARARGDGELPAGTWLVNLLGSLLLGALGSLVSRHGLDAGWRLVLGTGFCGGFTTFSTAAVESVRLVQRGRPGLALVHLVAGAVACVLAAWLGWAIV